MWWCVRADWYLESNGRDIWVILNRYKITDKSGNDINIVFMCDSKN